MIGGESNPSSTFIETRQGPWSPWLVRVFAQRDELMLDLPELLRATRRYFDATLEVQARTSVEGSGERVQVALRSEKYGYEGVLAICTRRVTPDDLLAARAAERLGRAAGMASLAERCPTVWEVSSVGPDSELARLNLCGILASVALGPVLPDDGSTLYGVRGAMERVEKLLRAR
jgi:hypothetical protein